MNASPQKFEIILVQYIIFEASCMNSKAKNNMRTNLSNYTNSKAYNMRTDDRRTDGWTERQR